MDMSQFKQVFLGEVQDILSRVESSLVEIEKRPNDTPKLQELFRDFHTLKGNAATMGLDELAALAHAVEDLLEGSTHGGKPVSKNALQAVFDALDCVKALLAEYRDEKDLGVDAAPLIERLKKLETSGGASDAAAPGPEASAPALVTAGGAPDEGPAGTEAAPAKGGSSAAIPELKNLSLPTVRVGLKKLDSIMNMVEELTVIKARLGEQAAALRSGELEEEIKIFERLIKQLQQEALETRLIPVADIFQGYRRVVRDTAKNLGKDVDFIVEDNGIQIDRALLEKVSEPLIHVLRNAIDHGLEDKAGRIAAQKPSIGTLVLRARREQGYAVVEVLDDGAGMDAKRIKAKAVKVGIVTQEQADAMSDETARYLVCAPGFSTRDEVTSVSGRGVGMDVVKTVLDSVHGRLEIESEPGKGSRVSLHLPLNLAIIQSLMLNAGGQTFAAPMSDVLEILSFDSVPLMTVEGEPVVTLRGEIIPVLDLAAKFGLKSVVDGGGNYGAVVRTIRGKLTLRVDGFLGRREIVVKNFEGFLKQIDGINSATILGDGRVVLILDVRGL